MLLGHIGPQLTGDRRPGRPAGQTQVGEQALHPTWQIADLASLQLEGESTQQRDPWSCRIIHVSQPPRHRPSVRAERI
jgi:hypothetical protein